MLIKTPIPNTKANPLIKLVPNQKRMTAVMMLEIFESRIASHARLNPSSTASRRFSRSPSSSFRRSKIRTFASTAIPIERINPAIPAAVRVTGTSLNNASITAT